MITLTKQIITEMAKFKIVNEVSLYLEEPISLYQTHSWRQKQQYDVKVKTFKDNINRAAQLAFAEFKKLLASLNHDDCDLRTYLAVALYFVTYYHPSNLDCEKYLQEFKDDVNLKAFVEKFDKYLLKQKH